MSVMVFDIETVALPLECFDDIQQEYLFREAEALQDEVSRQEGREKIARSFSLSPITGQILCIGMMNPDTGRGRALYIADDFEESKSHILDGKLNIYPVRMNRKCWRFSGRWLLSLR